MKSIRRSLIFTALCVCVCVCVLAGAAARAETFLSVLDDVPVMPGMAELGDEAVAFDAAAGRIIGAAIAGRARPGLDTGAVLAFYGASLPSLGWRAESPSRFVRDGEVLELAISAAKGRIRLDFALRPQ
jgi:hypothetical protein